jgi:hypothetical protein
VRHIKLKLKRSVQINYFQLLQSDPQVCMLSREKYTVTSKLQSGGIIGIARFSVLDSYLLGRTSVSMLIMDLSLEQHVGPQVKTPLFPQVLLTDDTSMTAPSK